MLFKSVPDRFVSQLPPSCGSNYLGYISINSNIHSLKSGHRATISKISFDTGKYGFGHLLLK
ncbi:hypothetical protein, partial [Escherichia coli]|uniref:hypothetical protein n=1 Tax=Escherichia coli TaxID=562 RepID=UPI0030B9D0CD